MAKYKIWQKFSRRAFEIQEEMKDFYNNEEMRRLLSSEAISNLRKAMSRVDQFMFEAEEEMIEKGEPEDMDEIDRLDVWFPPDG